MLGQNADSEPLALTYLRNTGSIHSLVRKYKLKHRSHYYYPELVTLKYDKMADNLEIPLVQECRGLIINTKTLEVVARPYDKFFNLGEPLAAKINLANATAYEKLDGSLIIMYWNPLANKWDLATTGTPDALVVGAFNPKLSRKAPTLNELFWSIFYDNNYTLPPEESKDYTFLFELCTDYNRVVVRYDQAQIVLHGIRHNITGVEQKPETCVQLGLNVKVVKTFPINSQDFKSLKKWVDSQEGTKVEGLVVVDECFNRVKLKNQDYLAKHYCMTTGFTFNSAINLVLSREIEEGIQAQPSYREAFIRLDTIYKELVEDCNKRFEEVKEFLKNDFLLSLSSQEARKRIAAFILEICKDNKVAEAWIFSLLNKQVATKHSISTETIEVYLFKNKTASRIIRHFKSKFEDS